MLAQLRFVSVDPGNSASADTGAEREIPAILRAKNLILKRYSEPLSLDDIVAESGLPRYRFLRLFKQETGLSPHEFMIRCRIERAKQLLLQGKPLIEIAIDTGFFDQSHFYRHFKRVTGQSPSSYRSASGVNS
jgi:AraC family transcriptional regulator